MQKSKQKIRLLVIVLLTLFIRENANAQCQAIALGPTSKCGTDSVQITASCVGPNIWFPGGIVANTIWAKNAGQYRYYNTPTGVYSNYVTITNTAHVINNVEFGKCKEDSGSMIATCPGPNIWYPGGITADTIWAKAAGWYKYYNVPGGVYSDSAVVVNEVDKPATIIASGPTSFCPGGSVTLTNIDLPGTMTCYDGVNDYTTIPNHLSSATEFLFTAYIKWDSSATNARVFSFSNDANHTMYLTLKGPNGKPRFAIKVGPNLQYVDYSHVWPVGVWNYIIVHLKNSVVTIDGTQAGAVSKTINLTPASLGATTKNYLGRSISASHPQFKGCLDEVRFYSGSLDLQNDVYFGWLDPYWLLNDANIPPQMVGFYKMNEGTGTKLFNHVTQIADGSLKSGAYFAESNAPLGPDNFTYLWSNGKTTRNITVNKSGNYTLTITTDHGCTLKTPKQKVTKDVPVAEAYVYGNIFGLVDSIAANIGTGFSYQWYKSWGHHNPNYVEDSITLLAGKTDRVYFNFFGLGAGVVAARCQVTNATGCDALSDVIFQPTFRIGSNHLSEENEIYLYPNPTTGSVTIQLISCENCTYELSVFDLLGQTVYSEKGIADSNSKQVDLSSLATGIYQLQFEYNGLTKNTKLVIQ